MDTQGWCPSSTPNILERLLGDSERAFVRGSNGGVGDMFLHLDFEAPEEMMSRERVALGWAIIRVLHPLLMCSVEVERGDFDQAKFRFSVPNTVSDVIANANNALSFEKISRKDLMLQHMNSPRVHISNSHLSHLTVSNSNPSEYHILMTAPHFTGDGTSLHQSTHDLLVLLSSGKTNSELEAELQLLLEKASESWPSLLPLSMESRLPPPKSSWARAAAKVNFLQIRQREIGDHILPRLSPDPSRPLQTNFIEHAFTPEETGKFLKACKARGVSVNNVLVALCGASWSGLQEKANAHKVGERNIMPLMLYTAINLRPFLTPLPITPSNPPTYWLLPLTYYTLSFPSYDPSSQNTLWNRAKLAKSQTSRAVKSPFLTGRARIMAALRNGSDSPSTSVMALSKSATLPEHARPYQEPTPSRALLGVSLIGNLDNTYIRSAYSMPAASSTGAPYPVRLQSVTTASKLKAGGMLLLAHTFGGKLWVQMFWDVNGFEAGVLEGWCNGVVDGVKELLE